MTLGTITITAGGKPNGYRGEPGVFAATLIGHERNGPYKSKEEGKPDFFMHDWTFQLDGQPEEESLIWYSTTESTGPKSRLYGLITALYSGKEPPVGTQLDITKHLIGRLCLVDVRRNDRGYLDVEGVMPIPAAMLAQMAPHGAAADAAAAAAPGRDPSAPF